MLFQPQVASWDDQKHMVALAAVSYVAKGEKKPTLGTIKIEADTSSLIGEAVGEVLDAQDHRGKFSNTLERADTRDHSRD